MTDTIYTLLAWSTRGSARGTELAAGRRGVVSEHIDPNTSSVLTSLAWGTRGGARESKPVVGRWGVVREQVDPDTSSILTSLAWSTWSCARGTEAESIVHWSAISTHTSSSRWTLGSTTTTESTAALLTLPINTNESIRALTISGTESSHPIVHDTLSIDTEHGGTTLEVGAALLREEWITELAFAIDAESMGWADFGAGGLAGLEHLDSDTNIIEALLAWRARKSAGQAELATAGRWGVVGEHVDSNASSIDALLAWGTRESARETELAVAGTLGIVSKHVDPLTHTIHTLLPWSTLSSTGEAGGQTTGFDDRALSMLAPRSSWTW